MSHDPFRKRYGIILSIGNRESGKTTWAVKKLVKEAITKRHYRTFFANLHVGLKLDRKTGLHSGYPGVRYITYEDFMKIREPAPKGVPTALVLVDQIHRWFDSRSSMSRHNIETSDAIVQSRQHGFDIIGTTWGKSFVDLRMRRFLELLVSAERGRKCFMYDYVDPDLGPIAERKMSLAQARDTWRYFSSAEEVPRPLDLEEEAQEARAEAVQVTAPRKSDGQASDLLKGL